jgi:hypothetical protein
MGKTTSVEVLEPSPETELENHAARTPSSSSRNRGRRHGATESVMVKAGPTLLPPE